MKYKWYSPFVFLVGAILSFADPITDILALVLFYRTDHKTWFGVALAFVILPCLVFPVLYFGRIQRSEQYSVTRKCSQTLFCGLHPFSAAFARLQQFVSSLKWRCCDEIDDEEVGDLQQHVQLAVMFESVLESIPQFIIQLYAVSVQEEPVEMIQIISLAVSFLSLAWGFTTADAMLNDGRIHKPEVKHRLVLFFTHLFFLSSRLFAVCYFTVSYKWWVIGVLSLHTLAIIMAGNFGIYQNKQWHCGAAGIFSVFFFCFHWLRDDLLVQFRENSNESDIAKAKTILRKMQLLSNVLFVVENLVMILLFYFSQYSNNWYALPVTVCVCLFSVVGSVMRIMIFHLLLKERIGVLR